MWIGGSSQSVYDDKFLIEPGGEEVYRGMVGGKEVKIKLIFELYKLGSRDPARLDLKIKNICPPPPPPLKSPPCNIKEPPVRLLTWPHPRPPPVPIK